MRRLKNYSRCLGFVAVLFSVSALQAQIYSWTTIAGNAGWGSANGTNSDGRFSAPMGMAADQKGNLFVTDYRGDTIRKITPAGTNWVVTTLAGLPGSQGSADGTNSAAQFYSPVGITVDTQGNLYVADCYNYVIRKLTPSGTNWVVTTIAGKARNNGSVDGTNNSAGFGFVYGVVSDANGNVYVADGGNDAIRKLTPVGTNWVVTTIAALGAYPDALAIDPQGNLYETDRSHTVRRNAPVGANWVVTVLAGSAGTSGSADGTNGTARFFYPDGLTADGQGHVLVADSNNHTLRCLTQQGTNWIVSTIAGLAGQFGDVDGSNNAARFYYPHDIAMSTNGVFYVTDDGNYSIRSLTPAGTNWVVGTIAGSGGPGSIDGTNNSSRFNLPEGLAFSADGNAYVVDQKNDTIRQLMPSGTNWVVSTIAGQAGTAGSSDGTNGSALFSAPGALTADSSGNLFLTDTGNHTIRRLMPQGTNWVVTTIGGEDTIVGLQPFIGDSDGTNSLARFNGPAGIVADATGNLLVADSVNNTIREGVPLLPTIQALSMNNGMITMNWFSAPQQTYQVQYKSNLLQTNWSNLGGQILSTNVSATATDAITNSPRFYRVEQLP